MSRDSASSSLSSHGGETRNESGKDLRWARFKAHLRLWQKWWLKPHKPFQPVFVIATWRSGSNLLLSYLNQQPNISVLSEVLLSTLPIGPSRDCIPPHQALRHIRYCLQGEKTGVRGCKLMLHQMSNCQFTLDDLHRQHPQAKYIVLYRQSLAEQFVSHKMAQATSQYILARGEQARRAEIVVNARELREYCDDIRGRYRDALAHSWLPGRAVLLSYEELVDDPAHWLKEQICPLLGVNYVPLETRLMKQNTRPLSEQIVNYRDVEGLIESSVCQQQHGWPKQIDKRAA